LQRATLLGKSVLEAFPSTPAARAYLGLSQRLLHSIPHHETGEDELAQVMRQLVRQLHRQSHPAGALLVSG